MLGIERLSPESGAYALQNSETEFLCDYFKTVADLWEIAHKEEACGCA
jgi:hypothetical protein